MGESPTNYVNWKMWHLYFKIERIDQINYDENKTKQQTGF